MTSEIKQFMLNSSTYQITLFDKEGRLSAEASKGSSKICFAHPEIKYGIIEDIPCEDLVSKVRDVAQAKLYAFPYPKKAPNELWIFEAIQESHSQIVKGKEYCLAEKYEKALKCFETALKLACKADPGGKFPQLASAISYLKSKFLVASWKSKLPDYLSDACEFEDLLEIYEDEADFINCLKELLSLEKIEPHQILLSAFINEEEGKLEEAAQDCLILAENNPKALACIAKAYSLTSNSEKRDAIRIYFEELLSTIDEESSQHKVPNCFICFDTSEKDVGEWLAKNLVPDLHLAGVKPLFSDKELTPGANTSTFRELARKADSVILACTPGLKEKCEARKKSSMGIALEVDMIKQRLSDPKQQGSTFPIFLKGNRKEALPSAYFEPIFGVKFSPENSLSLETDFDYYYNAFPLLIALRKIPEEARGMQEALLIKAREILLGDFDPFKTSDWRDKKEERINAVQKTSRERISALTQVVNLPLAPKNFTGRKDEIKELHAFCKAEQRIAISGLGGVGKTALAVKYANKYKSRYHFVHFTLATTIQMARNGLIKLADDLHISTSEKEEERLVLLKTALEKLDQEYLLIFDGVDHPEVFDEIEKWVPERGRSLLLTSRMGTRAEDKEYKLLRLEKFTSEDALDFIQKITGKEPDDFAEKIADKLGYLPLALKHAAMFIRQRKNSTYQSYLQRFEKEKFELFSREKLKNLSEDEHTILVTWQISIKSILEAEGGKLAKDIFDIFAILANAVVPHVLVEELCREAFQKEAGDVEDSIALLTDYSLLESSGLNSWEMHTLVHDVIFEQLDFEEKESYQLRVLKTLEEYFDKLDLKKLEIRTKLEEYLPHAESILEHIQPKSSQSEVYEKFVSLSNLLCKYYRSRGYYQNALSIIKGLLEIHPQADQDDHPVVDECYTQLGSIYSRLGKYEDAITYKEKYLKRMTKQYGEKHKKVAQALHNIGSALKKQSKYDQALDFYKNAYELSLELSHGEENLSLASSLKGMATIYKKLGKHDQALVCAGKSLQIRKKLLGDRDLLFAKSLSQVGSLDGILKNYRTSLECKEEALQIRKDSMGAEHPGVASSLHNIGSTYLRMGKKEQALDFYEKALQMSQNVLGMLHPCVAIRMSNYGSLLAKINNYKKGLSCQYQALDIGRSCFIGMHADLALILHKLGRTLMLRNKYSKASQFLKEAAEIYQKIYPKEHPETKKVEKYLHKCFSEIEILA